jgi:hypothetical protein
MALKLGNRVTVLPDESRPHLAGKRGEVVQIGKTQKLFKDEEFATCPDETMVLVDDQVVGGVRKGVQTMREWYAESELEVG